MVASPASTMHSGGAVGTQWPCQSISLPLPRATGVSAPFTALIREVYAAATTQYGPASDHTEVVRWQLESAKVTLGKK